MVNHAAARFYQNAGAIFESVRDGENVIESWYIMQIKVIVATHKPYRMPTEEMYLPVQAGAAVHPPLEYTGDNTGEEISEKNGWYCELTALYWAWKNISADVLGLCHYRRYFQEPGKKQALTEKTLRELLKEKPVILPKKRHYFIETGKSQFIHAHGSESYETLRQVMRDCAPSFLPAFERSMEKTAGHRFNMLIMRREQLDDYCKWLFGILFETEKRLVTPPPRMMGYLSERMIDAWIETKKIPYLELPVYQTEKVNWLEKGGAFLIRKIKGASVSK